MNKSNFNAKDLRDDMLAVEAEERSRFESQEVEPPPQSDPRAETSAKEPRAKRPSSDLPEIPARRPLRDRSDLILRAMSSRAPHVVSLRNDRLVRIRRSHQHGVTIEVHTKASLRGVVARSCRCTVQSKDGDVREVTPQDDVIDDLLTLPNYPDGVKRIEAVSETPQILADGRILTQPGLDVSTGIYMAPESRLQGIVIPERPTPEVVREAKEILDDIIVDMPFMDDASRANFIAFWLTPLVRHQIDGCVPVLAIDAPQQGSGKGLLTGIISITATGRDASSMVNNGKDDEERRKVLTSCLRKGQSIIILDNLTNTVTGASLASFVTSRVWQDRILGHSRVEEYSNTSMVILNGNNLRVAGDMVRRCVWSRLDPQDSMPHERTGFRHSSLLPYVKERRPEIVRALLTLARHWIADDSPHYDVRILGSFESWCTTLGSILTHAGISGFLDNMNQVYEQDDDSSEFETFLRVCWDHFGGEPTTAREIVAALDPDDLPSCIEPDCAARGSIVKRLGKVLAKYSHRRFGHDGIHIVPTRGSANTKRWQVKIPQES